jgi:hypothetical protein
MQGGHDMNCVKDQSKEYDSTSISLINHLYKRSSLAPIKTRAGNECVLVNMSGCSEKFLREAEAFFDNPEQFRILIRGADYYVEVLKGVSFSEAYNKSML